MAGGAEFGRGQKGNELAPCWIGLSFGTVRGQRERVLRRPVRALTIPAPSWVRADTVERDEIVAAQDALRA